MFYSQTFLARKGPLGTVWCAAHLQHRLKKSHYTSTNISSTVERIIYPEVPIALRMSGHLLLGVVRIYSKKVDYLYHDCNVFLISLRKTFSTVSVNLPEDAAHAPAHTVTLPQKFNLDAVDLDDHMLIDEYDNHLRSQEEITLTDQIPVSRDVYVAVTFDEDIMMDSMHPAEEVLDSVVRQMQEIQAPPADADVGNQDTGPSNQTEALNVTEDIQDPGTNDQGGLPSETEGFQAPSPNNQTVVLTETMDLQEPGPSNQTEVLRETVDVLESGMSNQTGVLNRPADSQIFPEVEVIRDSHCDFGVADLSPLFQVRNDATEPVVTSDQVFNMNAICTPTLEDLLASGEQSLRFQEHSEPPASAFTPEALGISDICVSRGNSSPAVVIQSSPPEQKQKQSAKKRIRVDKSLVLSNKFMKKALEDCSDLLRKKRNMPITDLGVWKLNNRVSKEQVLYEPLVTGSCSDVSNIFKKDYISTKPHLVDTATGVAIPEPMMVDSPAPVIEFSLEPGVVRSPSRGPGTTHEQMISELPDHTTEAIQEQRVSDYAPMPENIERLRHADSNISNDYVPEFMHSPSGVEHSPFRRDYQIPSSNYSFESESVPEVERTTGFATPSTVDVAPSTGSHEWELATVRVISEERLGLESTGLSCNPELINSAESEDLSFLEADDYMPPGSQSRQGVESLSVRTRAVAQFLRHYSSTSPSEGQSTDLSLNKILEGQTRTLCARMFFETLVLKNYGVVDVEQEQPYGDVILKLNHRLSKTDV